MFNKLKYYNSKFCKKYENEAINIMNKLGMGLRMKMRMKTMKRMKMRKKK